MEPNQQYDPVQQSNTPPVYGQQPSNNPIGSQQATFGGPKPRGNKRLIIIIGLTVGVVLLAIIGLVVFSQAGKKAPAPKQETSETNQSQGPQAATAISVEQINNSISQDIGGLNDDQDFPPDKLDDKTLKL